ncbi:MAG: hypothetical protein ABS46_01430 [Cytophagaceae bacterium SCN 52-12]|nr:MAG: hypothetical protein ABS46_01430 [Cytophagaceae bacterium SCN 52-12]
MRKTKLTLSVDPIIIERAKKAARRKGVSVSEMVEHYLNVISDTTDIPNQVAQLRGCARGELSGMSDKEIREKMYRERHGI